jgi:hypothetical protein
MAPGNVVLLFMLARRILSSARSPWRLARWVIALVLALIAYLGAATRCHQPPRSCQRPLATCEGILQYFADHGYTRIERYLEHDQVNYYVTPAANVSATAAVGNAR